MADELSFDRPKLQRLRARYDEAVAVGEDEFTFEGRQLLASYAKYVIEYLEAGLPP